MSYYGKGTCKDDDGNLYEVGVGITYVGFDLDWLKDQHLEVFFKESMNSMYERFAEEVNQRIDKWNEDYEKTNPKEDCWNNEYENYIFYKYQQIADTLNKTEPNGILEYHPVLVVEDEDRATYEGETAAVFGVRFAGDHSKYAYFTFFDPNETEV